MRLIEKLAENRILWFSFIVTVLLTIAFQIVVAIWNLTLLDALSDPTAVRNALSSMSSDQKNIHTWVTATLDVAYPLVYGALFVGSAHKFYSRLGWLVALPTFVLVPVDYFEGIVQVFALTGFADWIDVKAYLTPLKTILFLFGILATVVGWIVWLIRRIRN